MPRYINADNFRKTMIKRFGCIPCLTDYSDTSRYDIPIDDALKLEPIADVVEVVRCKDCKHGRPIDPGRSPEKYFKSDCVVCECEDVVGDEPMIYKPDHFCGCGERKENDRGQPL